MQLERHKLRLGRPLGRGALGIVHHAVLTEPACGLPAGTELAVKELDHGLCGDKRSIDALAVEREVGKRVRHPSLVRVVAETRLDKGPANVMVYVPGRTLGEALADHGPLTEPRVRSIGARLAGALAAMHAAGYTHGDVKPENVRLDEEWNVVLIDLGFAAPIDRWYVAPASPAYAAPELLIGKSRGTASDVFALGVVLYELATGEHPFLGRLAGDELLDEKRIVRLTRARYRLPSRIVPSLSPFLDELLAEVLARHAPDRPSAEELLRRLTDQESSAWWRARLESGAGEWRRNHIEHTLPLVGRDTELGTLLEGYREYVRDCPLADAGEVLWLIGEEGSGKSRLVDEFATLARADDAPPMYLYGRFRELEESRPCQAVLRLLQRFLRLPPSTAPGEAEQELLESLVPPEIAETLMQALDPQGTGETELSVPYALGEWLLQLGRETPLIVFLDDVHWAGSASLELLSRLVRELPGSRLHLVLGRRKHADLREPEDLERLEEAVREHGRGEPLELGPLPLEAVRELVNLCFHASTPRLYLAEVLWRRSSGNPGFLAEILRGLLRNESIRERAPDDRSWILTVDVDALPLPPSLRRAIADAYRELSLPDQLWLRRLAVVGGRIQPDFLLRAFPSASPAEVEAMLERLVRSGWLVAAGDRYRFARPVQREAVYRTLSEPARRRLHAAAAEALRAAPGQGLSLEEAFQRAFHLRAAGENEALLKLLKPLVARTLERGQYARVESLASWGLEAVRAAPEGRETDAARLEFLEMAADAADRLGNRRTQRERLDELADMHLDPVADAETLGRVYLLHGRYSISVGQYAAARSMLGRAAELFRTAGSDGLLSDALYRLAGVEAHVGDSKAARALVREAFSAAQTDEARALALLVRATVELLDGWYERGLRNVDQALQLTRRSGAPGAIRARGLLVRARIYRALGRPRRAVAACHRAQRLARQTGDRRLECETSARLGGLLLELDRSEEAEAELREAYRVAQEIEDRRGKVIAGVILGVLLAEADRDAEAEKLLLRSIQLAKETGLNRIAAYGLAVRARIAREQGDLGRADTLSLEAQTTLERYGAELADRIVIEGTRALIEDELGASDSARRRIRSLRQSLREENERLRSPVHRRRHRLGSTRLLEAVLSAQGPILPRLRRVLENADVSRD